MTELVFDMEHALRINRARQDYLDYLIPSLAGRSPFKTVLDIGCGVGYFSDFLSRKGFDVTAVDAKKENIEEARRRFPAIRFLQGNIEEASILKLGEFDVVLCFGLLYHLENPFIAIRHLCALTGRFLIAESVITPHRYPYAAIVEEFDSPDQSLNAVALIPSEPAFIKMSNRAGFQVYKPIKFPDHEDYREMSDRKRLRTVFIGTKTGENLDPKFFQRAFEPSQQELWRKSRRYRLKQAIAKLKSAIKSILKFQRRLLLPPIPVRLPWGSWWLAWNDDMGRRLLGREDYEKREIEFLLDFLSPGMTVFDIGAHQGLYALLASKKVGRQGQVIAFEPSARERRRFKLNIRLNRCKNVILEPFALGKKSARALFFICAERETGCNSLRPPKVADSLKTVEVPVIALDAYAVQHGIEKVAFIKVDVEGGERDFFAGAQTLLKQARPVILCELDDKRTKPWGYRAVELLDGLEKLGYRWMTFSEGGALLFAERKAEYQENLLAVPSEKLDGLISGFRREDGGQK